MAKGQYRGVNNIARKIVKEYRGVDNVARKVKKEYRGVNNVARLVFKESAVVATFQSDDTNVTSSYTISNGGRTLNWTNKNASSGIKSSVFRIDREGGFPSELTIGYTLKQSYGATVFLKDTGDPINYGNYKNAFDYDGSTNDSYVELETTHDDGTPDTHLYLAIQHKQGGTFTGEISNLTINGEPVEFVV